MNPRPLDCQSSALPAAPRPQSNKVSFTRIRLTVKDARGREKTVSATTVTEIGAALNAAPNDDLVQFMGSYGGLPAANGQQHGYEPRAAY